jgi:D-alanine-D-alanine ligase
LVEEFLPGKEINVAIFPDPERGFVVPTEIDFSAVPAHLPRFVTYDSKWNPESPEYACKSVPAQLSSALRAEVEALARRAFAALGGSGYGRVDMRLDREGRPCVIDVNPNNDIHPEAGLALAAYSVGLTYPELIARILARAVEVQRAATSHPAV